MRKHEFISELRDRLYGLPKQDIEESAAYYSELIEDYMEDGMSEEEAIASIGSAAQIATQILMDTPLPKLVKAKTTPRHALRAWEIVLLILGAPLWLSLLLAAVSVILAVYLALWAVIVSFYAVDLAFAVSGLAGVFGFVVLLSNHFVVSGLFTLGFGLVCVGLTILFFFACNAVAKFILACSKKILLWMKSCLLKKEDA